MSTPPNTIPSEFKAMVKSLATSGALSDFTVICGEKHYQVHRTLLMCHSAYFKTCFLSSFKEVAVSMIDLKDDPPEAIEAMMHYFYNFSYEVEIDDSLEKSGRELLLKHSMVYAVADKYQVPDLKELARLKFAAAWRRDESNYCLVAPHVFESTPDTDFGLRDIYFLANAILIQSVKDLYGGAEGDVTALIQAMTNSYAALPSVLAAEAATFGLMRQAGFLTPRHKGQVGVGCEALVADLLIYLTHKGGSRAEKVRALVDQFGHTGW